MTTQLEQSGSTGFFRQFFVVAALYDLILGTLFLGFYAPIYQRLAIPVPEHTSYVHMIAAFVVVQGLGYWFVSRNLVRNVDIVKVGATYKAAYVLVALGALMNGELPHNIFAWFAATDLLFLVGFVRFLMLAQPVTGRLAPQG